MHDEVVRILHGENSAKERSLAKEVEAARKAGVAEVKIAEYVAAKRKELMDEAAKKAESLMAEMQEATLAATEGEIAGKIRKIAEKVNKLREMEREMSPEAKGKAEQTITDYVGAERKKLLEEEKDSLGAIGTAHEKAAAHAQKGTQALHQQNQEARELHGTLEKIGGPNSPLISLQQMATGMNLFSAAHSALGGGENDETGLQGKNREFTRHHLTMPQLTTKLDDLVRGVTIGAAVKGVPSAPFDMHDVITNEAGERILQPKKASNGSPSSMSEATGHIRRTWEVPPRGVGPTPEGILPSAAAADARAAAGGATGTTIGPNTFTINIDGKQVSGDVKDPERLRTGLGHLFGAMGIERYSSGAGK